MRLLLIAMTGLIAVACGDGGGSGGGGGGGSTARAAVAVAAPVSYDLTAGASTVLLMHMENSVSDTTGRHAPANVGSTDDVAQFKVGAHARKFVRTSSQYIGITNSGDFDYANHDWEINFWMRSTNAALMYVMGQMAASCLSATNTLSIAVNNSSAGKLELILMTDVNRNILSTTTVTDGAWHHVVVARSGTTVTLTIDDVLQGSLLGQGATPVPLYDLSVGRPGECAGGYYDGDLDELRINKN